MARDDAEFEIMWQNEVARQREERKHKVFSCKHCGSTIARHETWCPYFEKTSRQQRKIRGPHWFRAGRNLESDE